MQHEENIFQIKISLNNEIFTIDRIATGYRKKNLKDQHISLTYRVTINKNLLLTTRFQKI